ncbi:hypothetical protein BH10CYA1_BH10CYA1_46380 [soil metagenome]
MRILIAMDGTEFDQAALQSVISRTWPAGSDTCFVEVSMVPHSVVSKVTNSTSLRH